MAHQGLAARVRAALVSSLAPPLAASIAMSLAGCGEASPRVEAATVGGGANEPVLPFPEAESAWGTLHSLRFHVRVPIPDPSSWTMDDHSRAELLATERSTHTKLVVSLEPQPMLVNRDRCEARARELGLVPATSLRTVEDVVTVGPEAYDTRVWVALEASKSEREPIIGHLFAFGAYVKRCLFVHLTSEVPSGRDETVLSQRLALARVRMLGGLTMDNFQDVPREKEGATHR